LKHRLIYIFLFIFLISILSCRATKFVPEDENLLNRNKIENKNREIEKTDLKNYLKQTPNKRIFYWRFYLSLYNLSNKKKENGFNNWLRKIGEPPVIYDEDLRDKSADQLSLFLRNKGYYNAVVTDSTEIKKRQATVIYKIHTGVPYRIRNIDYFFQDATLSDYILTDSANSKIHTGDIFDMDKLQEERVRVEELLRNRGYFEFTRDYVYYEIDSSLNSHLVDITVVVENYPQADRNGRIRHVDHPVYHINKVYLIADYRTGKKAMTDVKLDTVLYDSLYVVYDQTPNIRPGVVTQKNYLIPGDLYSAENASRTYRNLSSLSAFRMVDIKFREDTMQNGLLNCEVRITPATKQSYTIELEGTNSGGNIGAAGSFVYQHRNLFRGSEQFDLRFKGAIETLREVSGGDYGNMIEFGVEGRLRIPKFLLPFKTEQFIRRFNPQTNISLSYNYQKRPDYTRTIANASFGYNWIASPEITHLVFPIEVSLILTPFKSQSFQDWLNGKYLFYSYEPHFIVDQRYSFVYTNQNIRKNQDYNYLRIDLESAGNLLYAGYSLFEPRPDSGNYKIFGVDFSQYVKGEIDFRHFDYLYEGISFVTRGYIGAGLPYLNSTALPFEKQFFSGGANSVRAWQVKNLGPGSYHDTLQSNYPNQTGDLKIEANAEYRFKLFWKLETALFLDIGNIWSLSSQDDREGAQFRLNTFYKELAVGTGIGARLDFSFFIFRFDLGIPLRSPYPVEGKNWLPGNAGIRGKDLTLNIAIGYPF